MPLILCTLLEISNGPSCKPRINLVLATPADFQVKQRAQVVSHTLLQPRGPCADSGDRSIKLGKDDMAAASGDNLFHNLGADICGF